MSVTCINIFIRLLLISEKRLILFSIMEYLFTFVLILINCVCLLEHNVLSNYYLEMPLRNIGIDLLKGL